ncbi:HNH endonuclease [Sinomonas albida]|uniref:HNH endonuclease n=1 Tax=Sinomonas albida TaxID=369942 RepID=UPI001F3B812F|nr:HNH endonuclease [Sinomonas albida]
MGDWRSEIEDLLGRDGSGLTLRDIESFATRLGSRFAGRNVAGAGHGGPGLAGPELIGPELTGPELIDRIAVLERLKAAAAAEQARAEAAFAGLCEAGADPRTAALEGRTGRSPARVRERSAASQIALARSVSPSKGSRLLTAARRLVDDLPHTLLALGAGRLNEDRAVLVAEGVEVLSPADRAAADRELCADPRRLEGLGDRAVQDAVRACVDAIDDAAALARVRRAEAGRRVTVRRLPDSMAQLTAILPVAQAAAVEAALRQAAGTARASGDGRTVGQVAADTLVERATGQAHADAVPLRVGLVMTDASLFGGARESAVLLGYGTITAARARGMIATTARGAAGQSSPRANPDMGADPSSGAGTGPGANPDLDADSDPGLRGGRVPPGAGAAALAGVWLKRLFLNPSTGELAAMESKLRRFPRALADFIETRDQRCRTPFCDAPIRHIDHVVPAAQGGDTSVENGQGLCENCNHAKDSPGWEQQVVGADEAGGLGPQGDIMTVTPTGHQYYSPPVVLPGAASWQEQQIRHAG